MTTIGEHEPLLEARLRFARRDQLLTELREALAKFVHESVEQDVLPYEHGDVFGQIRHEVIELEADTDPASLSAKRRFRRKLSRNKRLRIYKRDGFTCKVCGWKPPDKRTAELPSPRRPGVHLTIGHKIPVTEGGSNAESNLQTECSICNNEKGRDMAEAFKAADK